MLRSFWYKKQSTLHRQQGDTLIEVILAITVFSIIIVASITMMNQGVATSQRALEITLARQAMDSQADALRFLQASYVQNYYSGVTYNTTDGDSSPAEEYYKAIQQSDNTASALGSTSCDAPPSGSFVVNIKTAEVVTDSGIFTDPTTYAQQQYSDASLTASEGLWIEGVRAASSSNAGYVDFHIRACWYTAGSSQPMNLGTIVRLYEPRG